MHGPTAGPAAALYGAGELARNKLVSPWIIRHPGRARSAIRMSALDARNDSYPTIAFSAVAAEA